MTVVLTESEPKLTLVEGRPRTYRSDCGNGCGNRVWCRVCRAEIRHEALRWLRELNVVRPDRPGNPSWSDAWSRDLLLAPR